MNLIDEYIEAQTPAIQERLCAVRNAIATAIPEPLQISFQGFRLAYAFHGAVPVDVFDESVDALKGFLILCLPIQVVLPSLV